VRRVQDPPPPLTYTDRQLREASDWFVAIRTDRGAGIDSVHAWLKWMALAEGHRAAFDAVLRAWHRIPLSSAPALPDAVELSQDEYQGDESVQAWLLARDADGSLMSNFVVPRSRRAGLSRRAWLSAAAVTLGLGGLLSWGHLRSPSGWHSEQFATGTAEQMEITLTDGSHVWLGPRSRLVVAYEPARRAIQLVTGEAFFSVKKELVRPFCVRSAGGDIVAVGTAFNVRATDAQVTVAVSEGIVAVTPATRSTVQTPASLRVSSGQQLTLKARQPVDSMAIVQSAAIGERARWREGALVYRDEPLRDVIADVLRYSELQIEIGDPVVGGFHYSGVIYHDALQEWLQALPESFPVTIRKDGNREIITAR
jgi:transmembrane sensor